MQLQIVEEVMRCQEELLNQMALDGAEPFRQLVEFAQYLIGLQGSENAPDFLWSEFGPHHVLELEAGHDLSQAQDEGLHE